jgi:division protein CdvB (Snf7/Vps24/ESCRT-III family)/DNA-dependent RNA polymerase auxiliary subunit epsilon
VHQKQALRQDDLKLGGTVEAPRFLIKLFQPPPQPIGETILESVRRLKIQRMKLEHASIRLRERDRVLFESVVREIKANRQEKAAICANELSEVRKLHKMVSQCQLALERITLRLETIKEVTEIMADLKPALRGLHAITENLVNVMPDVAQELERVNESISDTLAVTKFSSSPEEVVPLAVKTEAGEEILKEVSAVLENRIAEQLPAPPISATEERVQPRENVKKQMIALSATCSEITQPADEGESESYVTVKKDVEVKRVSYTIERQSSLEDALLDYAKEKGEIDVEKCADELSVPHVEVEQALENLGKKRRIVIQR